MPAPSPTEQYDTIQQAHDLGESGTVVVTSTYDLTSSSETLPIEIAKSISLVGTGRTGSVVNGK